MNRLRHLFAFVIRSAAVSGILAVSLSGLSSELVAADTAETIRIGGTGTDLATMKLLGKEFRKKYPDVTIKVFPSLGSSGGIKALAGGEIDIAVSSKRLSDAEQRQGLAAVQYGKTPFVFVTHKTGAVSDITLKQAADIYSGRTTTWPDGSLIRLIIRPAGESSTVTLQNISEEMKKAVQDASKREGLTVAIYDQENAELIEKIPGSFGVAALCQLISEKRSLKILSVNGIKPEDRTLADGKYPFFIELFMVTGPKPSPMVKQYADFVFSQSGRSVLTKTGHIITKLQR